MTPTVPDDLHIPPSAGGYAYRASYRAQPDGDGLTRKLLLAAVALGGLLLAGMGGWALLGRSSGTVPVIEADTRPVRVKPDNAGGMQVAGTDEMGEQPGGAQGMAPPAEAPAPQALRAQQQLPAVPGTEAPSTAPAGSAPSATAGSAPGASAAVVTAPALGRGAAPGPAVSPLPDTPRPAARTAAGRAAAAAAASPAAANAAPSSAAPAAVAQGGSASPAAAVPSASPAPAMGGTLVQLAAMDTEPQAQAEWQRLAKRLPDALGDRRLVLQRAERDGKPVWRVRTGGFADMADATAFCAKLRAKGASCTIAAC